MQGRPRHTCRCAHGAVPPPARNPQLAQHPCTGSLERPNMPMSPYQAQRGAPYVPRWASVLLPWTLLRGQGHLAPDLDPDADLLPGPGKSPPPHTKALRLRAVPLSQSPIRPQSQPAKPLPRLLPSPQPPACPQAVSTGSPPRTPNPRLKKCQAPRVAMVSSACIGAGDAEGAPAADGSVAWLGWQARAPCVAAGQWVSPACTCMAAQ
jgi:hypothetical protein